MKLASIFLLFFSQLIGQSHVELHANFPVNFSELSQILTVEGASISDGDLSRFEKRGKAKDLDKWIFWNLDRHSRKLSLQNIPKSKMVLFMWEPPSVLPKMYEKKYHRAFSKIYTWCDDLVDGKKYFKFNYPVLKPMLEEIPSFEEKKLCTLISGKHHSSHPNELYSLREKAIQFFESRNEAGFVLYGRGWKDEYPSYQGEVENKIEALKQFRFSICFENIEKINGYVTEKIFDCFAAGVIPIYLGAGNIEHFVPADCFIDMRDYPSFEALYPLLKGMSRETYDGYIKRIKSYLESNDAALFSHEHFHQVLREAVR